MENLINAIPVEALADIAPDGTLYNVIGILKGGQAKTTNNGKPYFTGELSDVSGSVPLIMWDYPGGLDELVGQVVRICGYGKEYAGNKQLNISAWIVPEPETYDMGRLLPTAPIPLNAYDRLLELAEGLDEPYNRLTCEMLRRAGEQFKYSPAAMSMHHAQLRGLLMHTYNMTRVAASVAKIYPQVNRSLLIAGCICHDTAKLAEFQYNDFGLVTEYTARGNLLGHIVMGSEDLLACARSLGIPEEDEAVMLLQHLILSHHGQPEWGAAVKPQTLEAVILSSIDLLDVRIETITEALDTMTPGTSDYNRALQQRIYCPNCFGKE